MLAVWVEERHGYVDPDGQGPSRWPSDSIDRIATMIASESGDHLAVIVHDPRNCWRSRSFFEAVARRGRGPRPSHRNRLQAELARRGSTSSKRERDFICATS